MGPTHITGGLLAGLSASAAAGLDTGQAFALTAGALAASRLPDVDAKLNPGPAHRSLPHSLVFGGGGAILAALLLLGWIGSPAGERALAPLGTAGGPVSPEAVSMAVVGSGIGYLTHLLLDACTKSGIWLLLPRGTRLGLPRRYALKTGGPAERLVAVVIVAGCLLAGAYVFAPAVSEALDTVSIFSPARSAAYIPLRRGPAW